MYSISGSPRITKIVLDSVTLERHILDRLPEVGMRIDKREN
jgi:hypothetical protein